MKKYQLSNALPKKFSNPQGEEALTHRVYKKFINHIQRVIEAESFEMRKSLFVYSDLIEKQRLIIQQERQQLLSAPQDFFNQLNPGKAITALCPSLLLKIKELCLFQFDRFWAEHLDFLLELKEGVHLVRIGGHNPFWVFQQKADEDFQLLSAKITGAIQEKTAALLANPSLSPEDLGMKKPSSTWTFVIGDNGFGDQLAMKLLSSSNIGLQVDFISLFLLFFVSLFRKIRSRLRS